MYQIKDILEKLGFLELIGDEHHTITKILPLNQPQQDPHALIWCSDKNLNYLKSVETGVIICSRNTYQQHLNPNCHYLITDSPRQAFQQVVSTFFMPVNHISGIESTAQIHSSAQIAPSVYIGHHVVIEANVKIGENTRIGHNTVIAKETMIGANVIIGSNNTIGNVGFGYEKNQDGLYEFIPHLGSVVIEDGVEIGNNTCIDRAVLGITIIRKSARIDNLVHIAHGADIGENALIIANAMIAGSVKIGKNAWVAPSSSILNQKTIGANSIIGLGAVVVRDVPDNDVVVGNPAKSIKKTI